MQLLIFSTLFVFAVAAPSRDYIRPRARSGRISSSGHRTRGRTSGPTYDESRERNRYGGTGSRGYCEEGLSLDSYGNCVEPVVSSHVFVYEPPELPVAVLPPPQAPKPKVNFNVVFVHTPKQPKQPPPIVAPPPETRTVLYVLTETEELEQEVIEVESEKAEEPHVFFVNYKEGDNPQLGGGLYLQDILEKQQGEYVNDDSPERYVTNTIDYTGPPETLIY